MDNNKLIIHSDPKSPVSEAYRTLRTNIQFSGIDKKLKTIIFTSSAPGEGKSTIASNLALSMALGDKKVILIDCDLRRPRVHKIFGINNYQGLTNILMGERNLKEVLNDGGEMLNYLQILSSGPVPPNPAELLGSKKMKGFLNSLSNEFDMVILDCPPIGLFTDSAILSTISDGTILILESGKTIIEEAQRAKELLDKVNANIIGAVLNKVKAKGLGSYNYGYQEYANYYNDRLGQKNRRKKRLI